MDRVKRFKCATIITAFGLLAFSVSANAVPIVYSGYDVGSTSLAGSPNATAAATAFDFATGSLPIIDFELPVPAGVSLSGGTVGIATDLCFTPDLHCYATSGTNVYRNNGASLGFSDPIDSFGAYFTGWQLAGQTITIGYSNGDMAILDMPAGDSLGGTLFYGFTDFGAAITSIEYTAGVISSDAVGIDDIRFGNASSVPEPATLLLLVSGLAFVGWNRHRQQA